MLKSMSKNKHWKDSFRSREVETNPCVYLSNFSSFRVKSISLTLLLKVTETFYFENKLPGAGNPFSAYT